VKKILLIIAGLGVVIAGLVLAKTPETIKTEISNTKKSAQLYQQNCADCHGGNLEGGMAANLSDDTWVTDKNPDALAALIQTGNEELGMPAFGDRLSAGEIEGLVRYVSNYVEPAAVTPATDAALSTDEINVETWIDDLETPWSLEFIDAHTALMTERSGKFFIVKDGKLGEPISGVPGVWNSGQGGLLDVALDPEYASNGWVYLSFSHPLEPDSDLAMTKIIRGHIKENAWIDEQVLFVAKPEHYIKARVHFGGRITFDDQGHMFFSIGERGQKDMAQDVTRPNGKIHRLNRDGSVPKDNPFVGTENAYPSIYSFGNRNPQGLVFTDGVLWETEHGPKGGDELNVIKPGANYGWPVISYGRNYNGTELTPYTHRTGMEQPISQWTPSIAACGLEVYKGKEFPEWNGYLLAGALKYKELRLIEIKDGSYQKERIILKDQGRVRDIKTGPDGAIYVVLNGPGKVLRLTRAEKG
jgi:glucose/arabinose dehydrogenase